MVTNANTTKPLKRLKNVIKNPDDRKKKAGTYTHVVRVYFKSNREWLFPASSLGNAREIAARVK